MRYEFRAIIEFKTPSNKEKQVNRQNFRCSNSLALYSDNRSRTKTRKFATNHPFLLNRPSIFPDPGIELVE